VIGDRTRERCKSEQLEPHIRLGDWMDVEQVRFDDLDVGDLVRVTLRYQTESWLARVEPAELINMKCVYFIRANRTLKLIAEDCEKIERLTRVCESACLMRAC